MKNSIRKIDFLIICGYCVFITLITFIVYNFESIEFTMWLKSLFWTLIAHIIVTFFCFKIIGVRLFSVSSLFIILSYTFHMGQVLVKGISSTYDFTFDVSSFISQEIYMRSLLFSLTIISLVSIGMMIAKIRSKNNINDENDKITTISLSTKTIKILGWIILIFTLPLEIYYSFTEIMVGRQLGYNGVLEVESSGILSQFARFHIIGIGLLIMSYSNKPFKSISILLIYSMYSVVVMLSGSRIYQVLSLLILSYILYKSIKMRFSIKTGLMIALPAFLLIVLLNTIAEIRLEGFSSIDDFTKAFKNSLINNPILDIFEEFGATIYTVCLTVIKIPLQVEHSHGLQFITGFLSVLPNINGIFTEINQTTIFTKFLYTRAIGGSYIAELYYSFEYTSYIAAILIGYFIQLLSYKFEYHLERKHFIQAAYFILPTFAVLLWVRGYYVGILRNSLWAALIIYLTHNFIIMFSVRKNKNRTL